MSRADQWHRPRNPTRRQLDRLLAEVLYARPGSLTRTTAKLRYLAALEVARPSTRAGHRITAVYARLVYRWRTR